MPPRNAVEKSGYLLSPFDAYSKLGDFDCGDDDLNEYFRRDAAAHRLQLMTQTYALTLKDDPNAILGLVDLCNDSIRAKECHTAAHTLPKGKRYPALPAVKITRFGIKRDMQRQGLGRLVVAMLVNLFHVDNRTGCRFITLDAYNKPNVLAFYTQRHFDFMTDDDKDRNNRAMYLDLLRFGM